MSLWNTVSNCPLPPVMIVSVNKSLFYYFFFLIGLLSCYNSAGDIFIFFISTNTFPFSLTVLHLFFMQYKDTEAKSVGTLSCRCCGGGRLVVVAFPVMPSPSLPAVGTRSSGTWAALSVGQPLLYVSSKRGFANFAHTTYLYFLIDLVNILQMWKACDF